MQLIINTNFINFKILVTIHNLRGYDSHLIILTLKQYGNSLIKNKKDIKIDCLVNIIEKICYLQWMNLF